MTDIPEQAVEEVARAIAENGFGRPWDDFLPLNAFDTDQADLRDYARAALAAAAPFMNGWRDIAKEPPPQGQKLLAGYRNELGNWRTITAAYYLPGTLDAAESCDNADEDGFAPEGWYEESETHDELLRCHTPTHWMYLPSPPVEGKTNV